MNASEEMKLEADYSIYDLEHLTQFAFNARAHIEQADVKPYSLAYAVQVFKGLCYVGDAIVRLHPKSNYYAPSGRQIWNPTSMFALARVLMEACSNFHYFAVNPANDAEREFRFILANLHCVREREDSAQRIEAQGPPPPQIPDDWSGLSLDEQHRLLPWLERANLPNALHFWKAQLERNQHFASL